MSANYLRAALAVEVSEGAERPREILLMPAGEIRIRPGDRRAPWHNPDADGVAAATAALAGDLPNDYERQGALAKTNSRPAPAAGWIRHVFSRDGAVWGDVAWNERAAMIRAREYRFISPLFDYDRRPASCSASSAPA